MADVYEKISDIGAGWGQMIGLGPIVGETTQQQAARKKAERTAAARGKKKPVAPMGDEETTRRAAERRRARTKAGTGRAGTMLSSDTLG